MTKNRNLLTVIQLNNSHAYFDLHQEMFWQGGKAVCRPAGGYARIAAIVKQIRAANGERVLFCDCGDTLQGTYSALKTQGQATIPVLNSLGIDAMTAHWEFAYGPAIFKQRAAELGYPMLAINVYDQATKERLFPPYRRQEMTQKMTLLTIESLAELTSVHQPPCLSLYQPTHRRHPENQQDPIRFRNLVKELETALRQKYPAVETRLLLEPFEALAQDRAFWNHTLDGLAVLRGSSLFRVFRLQRPVAELAVVADSFHTKPLRRFLQSVGRYQVLGLSLQKIQLFEGNRDALDEIDPAPGVPRTITEALGEDLTESHQTVASYGGVGGASTPMHHGHGGKKDVADIDAERFFRAIDRAVLEHHSRPSGLPLMLAALPEHHHLFRRVSHNPFLMAEGLTINPDVLPIDELRERAWQIVAPQYQAQLATLADEFAVAKSNGLGSDDLAQVAQAAAAGRVATLLIESDRRIAGRVDDAPGRVEAADLSRPQVDDLLDDLGELVGKMGGRVLVIPAEQMPGRAGLAAIYRY